MGKEEKRVERKCGSVGILLVNMRSLNRKILKSKTKDEVIKYEYHLRKVKQRFRSALLGSMVKLS